jgi:hypothetical protein
MNSLFKLFICTLTLSFLVLSCRKDVENQVIVKEDPPAPVINYYGNIFGLVVDNNDNPVVNATVIYGNETLTTDDDGLFLFKNVKMNANGTYVQVEKQDFFMGSRRIYPNQNATNYMEIKLLDKTIIGTVNAQSGGTLNLQNGAKIELPANGIVDASGTNFDGTVNVAMNWLDPTAADLPQIMPGSLEALDEESQRVLLQTYGMLAVELESADGEPLNLGNGGMATLTFPVPGEIIGSAPPTIPLWYFDEVDGIWREEGSAQLVGNEYVGEVSHFSFWNCDAPFPLVSLSGCYVGFEGTNLSNTRVDLEVVSTGLSSFANTDDQGCFSGLIPLGEVLNIKLIGQCGTVLFEDEIGPFDEDTDLGTVALPTFNDSDLVFVQGTLVDCEGLPINDGILRINSDAGNSFFFTQDGSFSVPTGVCPSTSSIFLSGSNPADDQTAFDESVEFPVEPLIDAGDIEVCTDPLVLPDTYMKLTLDGESYVWDLAFNSGGQSFAQITSNDLEVFIRSRNIFPFDTTAISVGIFDLVQGQNTVTTQGSLSFSNFNGLFSLGEDIAFNSHPFDEFDVFISEIGEVGEPVTGTISHEVVVKNDIELLSITPTGVSFIDGDSLGVFPITIDFRILRTQ